MQKVKIPLIGITSNLMTISEGPFQGQGRFFLNQGYVDSIVKAGGNPILLPPLGDRELIRRQLSSLDGLIFSGGHDVHPSNYGEEPHSLLGETSSERDAYESKLLEIAYEMEIPLLGICRGMQLMNVYFGGKLHQDLSLTNHDLDSAHVDSFNLDLHEVNLAPKSLLAAIFQTSALKVNSYHHQTVKEMASGLQVTATSADGFIEGIAHLNHPWLQGVQWHPEVQYDEMEPLFKAFIQAAIQHRGER